jgi:hypothetical protein
MFKSIVDYITGKVSKAKETASSAPSPAPTESMTRPEVAADYKPSPGQPTLPQHRRNSGNITLSGFSSNVWGVTEGEPQHRPVPPPDRNHPENKVTPQGY